jgi:hypothetical protein
VLLKNNVVTGATLAFRRDFLKAILPIPATWVHDAWIALLIAALGKVAIIDEPLVFYRQHQQQQIGVTQRTRRNGLAWAWSALAEVLRTRSVCCEGDEEYSMYADQYGLACERLAAVLDPSNHRILARCQAKAAHFRVRADMSNRRWMRFPMVMGELLGGRYHRYSSGSKSLAKDLVRAASSDRVDSSNISGWGAVNDTKKVPLVVVVVLNWNGRDDTVACLESLRGLRYPHARILIVDNGSTDDSVAVFRRRFPAIRCLQTGSNLGFAEGNNVGIRAALADGADYVWLMNNDATTDPDALDRLVEAAESRPDVGIVGPKIYYAGEPRRIWFAGGAISPLGRLGHEGWNRIDEGQWDTPHETGYVTGCAFLVKRAVLEKVGLFAPEYFLLFEEADRACAPGVKVFDVGSNLGRSSPTRFRRPSEGSRRSTTITLFGTACSFSVVT